MTHSVIIEPPPSLHQNTIQGRNSKEAKRNADLDYGLRDGCLASYSSPHFVKLPFLHPQIPHPYLHSRQQTKFKTSKGYKFAVFIANYSRDPLPVQTGSICNRTSLAWSSVRSPSLGSSNLSPFRESFLFSRPNNSSISSRARPLVSG